MHRQNRRRKESRVMKKVLSGTFAALALLTMFAFACKKEESGTTDSYRSTSSTTSITASDTSGTTSTNTTTSPLSAADKGFAMKAAEGGMAEVSIGQMAAQKATDADVKNFGNRMVNDH